MCKAGVLGRWFWPGDKERTGSVLWVLMINFLRTVGVQYTLVPYRVVLVVVEDKRSDCRVCRRAYGVSKRVILTFIICGTLATQRDAGKSLLYNSLPRQ